MSGLNFDKVIQDPTVKADLIHNIKQAFLDNLPSSYTTEHLNVTLFRGSVKAKVDITPVSGSSTAELKSDLQPKQDLLKTAVSTKVKAMPKVLEILEDGANKEDLMVTATDLVEFDPSEVKNSTTTTTQVAPFVAVTSHSEGATLACALWTTAFGLFALQ